MYVLDDIFIYKKKELTKNTYLKRNDVKFTCKVNAE